MAKDIYEKTRSGDLFDDIELDLFDDVELPLEDKIAFSDDMGALIKEEIKKEIKNLPIGKIVSNVLNKSLDKQNDSISLAKKDLSEKIEKLGNSSDSKISKVKKEIEEALEKLKDKYDKLKTDILNHPRYEFGGFSPQVNDLNIGLPTTEGSWRIVISGDNLSVQRRESDAWVEKGSFNP